MIKYPKLHNESWLRGEIEKKSLRRIAKEIGCSYGAIAYISRKLGIHPPFRFKHEIDPVKHSERMKEILSRRYPKGRFGKDTSNWRGGRRLLSSGYIYIYKPSHPNCTRAGYVMEHRLVMEKLLGRFLKESEDVHHINGNRSDNRPENLHVGTRKEHLKEHFDAVKELALYKIKYGELNE